MQSETQDRYRQAVDKVNRMRDDGTIAPEPAAPSPPAGGGEPVAWRFLDNGEIIAAGDEAPSDDCSRWEPVNRWAVGCPRSSIFKIIRRRVTPSPDAAQQRIRELEEALEVSRHANDVFAAYGCPVCNGDCAAANPPVMGCPMSLTQDAARRARTAGGGHE